MNLWEVCEKALNAIVENNPIDAQIVSGTIQNGVSILINVYRRGGQEKLIKDDISLKIPPTYIDELLSKTMKVKSGDAQSIVIKKGLGEKVITAMKNLIVKNQNIQNVLMGGTINATIFPEDMNLIIDSRVEFELTPVGDNVYNLDITRERRDIIDNMQDSLNGAAPEAEANKKAELDAIKAKKAKEQHLKQRFGGGY